MNDATGLAGPGSAVERIECDGILYALIIRGNFDAPGIHFFTEDTAPQQLAYMHHPAGKPIAPHLHLPVERRIGTTSETLVVRKGRLRVDLYREDRSFLESRVLSGGDIILLCAGGHGFDCLEETEMVEIKQGPYAGADDKVRFAPGDGPAAGGNHGR